MTTRAKSSTALTQPPLNLQPPEGVYVGMNDAAYFAARAIGSTDLVRLYWSSSDWWFDTAYNPARRAKLDRKSAKDLGSALHALSLRGDAAYLREFVTEPSDTGTAWLNTLSEVKEALRKKGVHIERGDFDPGRIHSLARKHGLAHRVRKLAWTDYETARRNGTHWLDEDEDRRVRDMAGRLLAHEGLGPMLTKNGLSEVAVFWRREEDPDTLLRAKFDRLRPKHILDLKTVGNYRGRELDLAIRQSIEDHDYGIQRRLYHEARTQAQKFIRAGQVYAWSEDGAGARILDEEQAVLDRLVDAGEDYQWIWVFAQLRVDDVGRARAPVIAPRFHKPEGRIWDEAGEKIEKALAEFRALRAKHGLTTAWALIEPVRQLVDDDVRSRKRREYTDE